MAPRKRYIQFRNEQGVHWERFTSPYLWGAGEPGWTESFPVNGVEDLQISDGHPWHLLGKSAGDIGGDFMVTKHSYEESENPPRHYGVDYGSVTGQGDHYYGPQYPYDDKVNVNDWPYPPVSTGPEMDALGTIAIANTIPTNPLAGLSVTLGELRQAMPTVVGTQLWRDRALTARNAGSEYLNVQFGWVPLLSDVQSLAHSVTNSDKLVAQYVKDSGKRIKRRLKFPTEQSTTVTLDREGFTALPRPAFTLPFYDGSFNPQVHRTRTIKTERWFSGCFTYYLPQQEGLARSAAIANKLYGTRITPETLWDLTPWSWAADWFGNFGHIVHNVSAFLSDGLVMPYAYMMEKSTITDTYVGTGVRYKSYPGESYSHSQSFTTTVKQRKKATPYGFGLLDSSFTQRQWAILTALGLSRGGGKTAY